MVVKCLDAAAVYAANPDLKKEDIQQLQEWLKSQPHIPPVNEFFLQQFLHSCYYSNEAAKRTIDYFFTIRAHSPELFGNRDPRRPDFQETLNSFVTSPMKNRTPEGYLIMYTRLVDFNPDIYHFNQHVTIFDMRSSLLVKEVGCVNGHVVVLDMIGGTFAHLTRVSLTSLKKLMLYMQDGIPLRLKAIHFMNPVPFMDKVLAMIKPFLRKELVDLLFVHTTHESLHKIIPVHCLPKEIGGTGPSAAELHKENVQYLCENADILIDEEKLIADESKRPGKPKTSGDLFGVEGTFKKLDID